MIFKRVQEGRPYPDHGFSARDWASVPPRNLRLDDVARLTLSISKVRPFIATADWRPTLLTDRADLRALVAPKERQLELFAG